MDSRKKEPDDYVTYGDALPPLEEDDIASKKPIRIEDQEVRDENGRRRFHGAFTGGFSAGYYNTVDTKEGWRPAEFKSSRGDRQKKQQKPEDFMDQEDLGAFGIAPQILRARDEYGEGHVSRKRVRQVFAPTGAIPGMPALHNILHPVKETIGIKLLRAMGWKPNQGVGERMTKKAKKARRKKYEKERVYGCVLPPGSKVEEKKPSSDGEATSDDDDDDDGQLYAPDDVPAFVVKPKTNKFGLGYSGLMPQASIAAAAPKSGFVLFEPTLKLTDRKKKLQIKGQAFGVGAFEDEDEDIYGKDDMSQYDFELGGDKSKKKSTQMLALPCSDILDGFVRATRKEPVSKRYPPPVVPKDFVPIHRSETSRFDVKPLTEADVKGLGRHDLNAHQRAAILNEVLNMPPETPEESVSAEPTKLTPAEVVAQALAQIKKNIAAQQEKSTPKPVQPASVTVVDPDKAAKLEKLKAFIESSRTISTFQPFARDGDKQYRFEAYCILSKNKRLEEFQLLQPDNMTAWEREREEVEFDRSLTLYRPLTATMQNRFTSGGHVEENIQGGLVAQIESFLPQDTPQPKKEPVEKDPAKRAARRKHFGPLTRKRIQWKPDRLLCIRFNVPNPFPNPGDAQDSSKFSAKGVGAKFSIFDVLHAGPQVAASFISTGYENVTRGPVEGPANKVQELEWDKAARGELQEKAEPGLIPEAGPSEENKEEGPEEEVPYQRPPLDLFKSIFADSESDEEEEEEEVVEIKKEPKEKPSVAERSDRPKSPDVEEMDEDTYGPRLPVSGNTSIKVTSVSLVNSQEVNVNQEEWVERDKVSKKKKEKKNKKSKKKKDKKSKKRKRRHSDVSSSSTDDEVDDAKILKKIVALKKLQKL